MSKHYASPFKCPSVEAVRPGEWLRLSESGSEPLQNPVENWDYSVDLNLMRSVVLDVKRILRDCELKDGSRLSVVVHVKTGDAGIRNIIFQESFLLNRAAETCEVIIERLLGGEELQGGLSLTTRLLLEEGVADSELSPIIPGSCLWEDTFSYQLEGGGGRLPMETADFKAIRPEIAGAPWFLDVDCFRPEANFIRSCRVVLNSNRGDILEAIQKKDALVLSLLSSDLVRHACQCMLDLEGFGGQKKRYEEGSFGFAVMNWLETAFPGQAVNDIRILKKRDLARFEAILSSTYGGGYVA